MIRILVDRMLLLGFFLTAFSPSTSAKTHVVALGKVSSVQWVTDTGSAADKPVTLKVRPLLVDGNVKEFTLGAAHDVTDRLFVVRRVFRVNDSLPQEAGAVPHWQWQRGGWLLVDRITGRVSVVSLPEFDGFYSGTSWYRDYAAYCGVSDDGKKVYALVAQIGRRKPLVKKLIEGKSMADTEGIAAPDSACSEPAWQRAPARVTFEIGAGKVTFVIRGHVADLVADEDENEDGAN